MRPGEPADAGGDAVGLRGIDFHVAGLWRQHRQGRVSIVRVASA
jgi:UDP-N-acetylglucosamine enolpyruvyl transferase